MNEIQNKPIEEMTTSELVQRFHDDLVYSCHSMDASYSRSFAGRRIINIEKGNSLGPISDFIERKIIPSTIRNYDLDRMFLTLISDICEGEKINFPYNKTPIGEIDMQVLVEFCKKQTS